MFLKAFPLPMPTRGGVHTVDISGEGGATGGKRVAPRPLPNLPTVALPRPLALDAGSGFRLGSIVYS